MSTDRQALQDFLETQFYNIRHKQWMSLSQVKYLKMQAVDQQLTVRETPRTNVEIWRQVYLKAVSQ